MTQQDSSAKEQQDASLSKGTSQPLSHPEDLSEPQPFTRGFWKESIRVLLELSAGSALYSLGLNVFYTREKLLSGGVAGFAQILNYSFGLPVSLMVLVINIPLFILGLIFVNRKFMAFSLVGMLIFSGFIELFSGLRLSYDSTLTSIVCGGCLTGFGLGLIYRSGASVGGTDIINKILHKYFAMNMAVSGLMINILIVLISAFIYGLDKAVMTVCAMYIGSQITSYVIDGIDHRRAIIIITDKKDEVCKALLKGLDRGVTVLPSEGAFTHKGHYFLYCVISKHQLPMLKSIIKKTDPNAFFTILMATGVYGHGHEFFSFRHIES